MSISQQGYYLEIYKIYFRFYYQLYCAKLMTRRQNLLCEGLAFCPLRLCKISSGHCTCVTNTFGGGFVVLVYDAR